MRYLSGFSPSETLILLNHQDVKLSELLKVTFMDLLLKKVLTSVEISKQYDKRYVAIKNKYIVRGQHFFSYFGKEYENVFLAPFIKSNDIKILFRHIAKMGYQNSRSQARYKSLISKSAKLSGLTFKSQMQKLFGGFSINEKGIELKTLISKEIAALETELPDLMATDKERAFRILKEIGGNVFLLKNIDFELLHNFDKDLMTEMKREREGQDIGSSSCSGYDWASFNSDYSSFESGNSGDAGDSGCSGCSGSGCSGCGGGGD